MFNNLAIKILFGFKRNMDSVNFGATKIRTVRILKRTGAGYAPCKVHFIKLDLEKDIDVLESISKKWKNSLISSVYEEFEDYALDLWNNYSIFALTEPQKYGRKAKLDADKILGAALFLEHTGSKENEISILQTKPEYISHDRISDFKHIGQGIVRSIQKKFHKKSIILDSEENAVDFYIKQGFVQNKASNNPYQLIWNPKKSFLSGFFTNLFHYFIK